LQRADGETLQVPLRQTVPSHLLASDEAIINAAAQWLRPDSQEMRSMRLYAVHDAYIGATAAIKKEVLAGVPDGVVTISDLDENKVAQIQQLLIRSDIERLQKQLLDQTKSSNDPLNAVQRRIFEEPDKVSLGGMWRKEVRDVFKTITERHPGIQIRYDVGTEELIIPEGSSEKRVGIRTFVV
jgi:hypothetical protein